MPSLRRLSGMDVVSILAGFGFEIVSQRGSHLKLRRISGDGERQTLTIPNHKELDTGTLRALCFVRRAGTSRLMTCVTISFG
jgi:predicted RNA binding protein YcfA (HicA-like mRNA interferase family)